MADISLNCDSDYEVRACDDTGPVLQQFYRGYDAAFADGDKKESYDGFVECLALNEGASYSHLQAEFGAFRELVAVLEHREGDFAGGVNFASFRLGSGTFSANVNYLYVSPTFRRRGNLSRLLSSVVRLTQACLGGSNDEPVLIFLEVSDPFAMSDQERLADERVAGMSELDRLAAWASVGAKLIDFPYVQPPLSADQAPDTSLTYAVIGAAGITLAPDILRQHLERFFSISVLKGKPIDSSVDAQRQLAVLEQLSRRGEMVNLLDVPEPAALGAMDAAADGAMTLLKFARLT